MQQSLKGTGSMPITDNFADAKAKAEQLLIAVGGFLLRYGIVFFLVLFGAAKWTAAEAAGIQPLIAHSPFLFWIYKVADVQRGSEFVGVLELTIALLIALRPVRPLLSALGSLLAIGMFLTTLSFLFTTPGLDPKSSDAGFMMKDLILLGAACWSAGEALRAVRGRNASPSAPLAR